VTPQAVAGDQTPRRLFLLLASSSGGFVQIADSSKISVGKEHYPLDRGARFPCSQDGQRFQTGWVRAAPALLHGARGEVVPRACMLGPIVHVELSEPHASNMPPPEPELSRKKLSTECPTDGKGARGHPSSVGCFQVNENETLMKRPDRF
jgi:hypothetical protein